MPDYNDIWSAFVEYMQGDRQRIEHAQKVHDWAVRILEGERKLGRAIDEETVRITAMLHDIGIHEAERKHGSADGPYQEEEGPPIARRLLGKFEVPDELVDHVCRIIASHHSPGEVDTPEFEVVCDADWMVNIPDMKIDREKTRSIIERWFLTKTGKEFGRRFLLNEDA
jgi:hypothetical protein